MQKEKSFFFKHFRTGVLSGKAQSSANRAKYQRKTHFRTPILWEALKTPLLRGGGAGGGSEIEDRSAFGRLPPSGRKNFEQNDHVKELATK